MSEVLYTRRDVLKLSAGAVLGITIAGCGERTQEKAQTPEVTKSAEKYPEHQVIATIFYIGEQASASNAGIDNISTAWENDATKQFGGVDDPENRNQRGLPADFTPKENPFYVALPASEFDKNGLIAGARASSPWVDEISLLQFDESLFKGRWVEVMNPETGEAVYGQWVDTGPSADPKGARDYEYVFGDGSVTPKNDFGLKAGIDVSPAMAHHLGFDIAIGGIEVVWRFVDPQDIPDGPWRDFPPIDNKTHWN